jgi:uncharacterized protein (TIGR02145 family)
MRLFKSTLSLFMIVMIMAATVLTGCKKDDDNPTPPGNTTGTFTDSRDGHIYNWAQIGDQVWMTENLAYKPDQGTGFLAYDNDENNVPVYGYLYTWDLAQTIAPVGWHLPSEQEFRTLVNYLGGDEAAYKKLLEKGTAHWGSPNDATNESGFTALPAGYFDPRHNAFRMMGTLTSFHTSSEYPGDNTSTMRLVLNQNFKDASVEGSPKVLMVSVRCVKN